MNQQTFKKIFRNFAISEIIAILCGTVGDIIDSVITGKFIGGDGVAAIGYAFPAIFFYLATGTLISYGAQIRCSKYIGEGKVEKARSQFTVTMIILMTLALVLLGTFCIFSRELAALLGAEGENMINLTSEYLFAVSFCIVPTYIMFNMVQVCNIDGNSTTPIIAVLTLIVCDIVFDLVNVLVIEGGLFGMGIASSISYAFAAIIMITHLFSKKSTFKLSLKAANSSMWIKPLGGGLPAFVQNFGLSGVSIIINYLLTDGDNVDAVAAFSIGGCVLNIFLSIANGLAPSILTLGGIFYGYEDKHSIKLLHKEMLKTSIVWNGVAFAVVWALTTPFAKIFSDEATIIEICKTAIPLLCSQMIFYCLDMCFQYYLLAIGKVRFVLVMSFISFFAYCGACAFILKALFGTNGIWLCYTVGKLLSCLTLFVYVVIKNKGIPKRADDWIILPETFEADKLAEKHYEICSIEDATTASESIWAFCSEYGATEKTRFVLSLFVEEMGTNSVYHGFDSKKKNQLDVSISCYKNYWKIRLRDNGKLFNPIKFLEIHCSKDPERCIGIKMATKMVEDVQYLSTFNLNNIVVKIKK